LIGASLGVFFGLYLRRDLGEEQLLTVLLGIIVFTSGLAYYLRLSPIFVNFLLGVVLNMMGRGARLIEGTLSSFERPLYIVLFFFAGGSLALSGIEWWVLLLVIPYLLLRYLGRWLGGLLSVRLAGADYRIPPLGRVLLVPGGLSVAMLLNFEEAFGDRLAYINSMYAAMLLAVVLSEVHGHGRARSWLIDATDVDPSTIRRALTARAEEESL
jgi:Kef-type K+ transport system membrane component KefB